MEDILKIGGKLINNRLFIGTGKFSSHEVMKLPGDSPITRSVWTAVALAPLWCLTGTLFGKKIALPDRKLWTKNGNGFSMAQRP